MAEADPTERSGGSVADRALDIEIARRIYKRTGIGYYGPPAEGRWDHNRSRRFDTAEGAAEARRQAGIRDDHDASLCFWKDGWGPLYLPEYSTDVDEAMTLIDEWPGNVNLRRQNGYWKVELFRPSEEFDAIDESLPRAICVARLKVADTAEHA